MSQQKTTKQRPGQNSDGQRKQPSANPDGGASAAPQQQDPAAQGGQPSSVPPGGPPSMADVQAQAQARQAQQGGFAAQPAGAVGARSDARTQINFKDLPPMGQAQAEEQAGINPAAPLQMIQGQLQSSLTEPGGPMGGPQAGPVPASFIGPMTPPGTENFPHDMSALLQVMQRGYSSGSSPAEHEMALNAHSMARVMEQRRQNDFAQAQQHSSAMSALGGLLQTLNANGTTPHPADVAAHVAQDEQRKRAAQVQQGIASASPQGAPQLSSSY